MSEHPVAVVTGANRGLGLETSRQLVAQGWTVVITGRDDSKAAAAAAQLRAELPGAHVLHAELDVLNPEHARALADRLCKDFGWLNALVNNAGAIFGSGGPGSVRTAEPQAVLDSLNTNAVGALRVSQALLPLLLVSRGTIVNVSSGMGGLAEMDGGFLGYRMSKAALNVLTRVLHAEHHAEGLRVNSVCPGWVKTDMGGEGADRDVADGASGIVWAASRGPNGPSGGFFRDGEPIPW